MSTDAPKKKKQATDISARPHEIFPIFFGIEQSLNVKLKQGETIGNSSNSILRK